MCIDLYIELFEIYIFLVKSNYINKKNFDIL